MTRRLERRISDLEDERGGGPGDRLRIELSHRNADGELVERDIITEQPDGSFETETEEFDADYAGPWTEERDE